MSGINRIIIFLLMVSVSACVSTQSNMSAANDEDQDIGIGGTGIIANTGNGLGGTGIVGEITGFGSIFVNGIEVEYDSKTPFTIDGKSTTHHQLAIGDVVEVLTTDANKHTRAQVVNLRHEVVGRVESVNSQTYRFTVLGQTVIQPGNKKTLPEAGTMVAVSGFRIDEQTIQATRVTPAEIKQTLLRTHSELPFKKKTARWLIQTHVQNGKAVFRLDGTAQVLSLRKKAGGSSTGHSGIRILQLQKSVSGQIKIDRVIESMDMPRGRRTPIPFPRRDSNMMQRPMPMHVPMNRQPKVYRRGR